MFWGRWAPKLVYTIFRVPQRSTSVWWGLSTFRTRVVWEWSFAPLFFLLPHDRASSLWSISTLGLQTKWQFSECWMMSMRMDEDDNDDAMEVHSGRDYVTGLSSALPFNDQRVPPLMLSWRQPGPRTTSTCCVGQVLRATHSPSHP